MADYFLRFTSVQIKGVRRFCFINLIRSYAPAAAWVMAAIASTQLGSALAKKYVPARLAPGGW